MQIVIRMYDVLQKIGARQFGLAEYDLQRSNQSKEPILFIHAVCRR
jgi:hypothetical protein